MSAFLAIFFTLYTLMHTFVFVAARSLFLGRLLLQAGCILFFAAMIVAPVGARLLERSGHESLARLTAWIGYPWMGFVFLSFCALVIRETINTFAKQLNTNFHWSLPVFDGRTSAAVVFGIVALISLYGYMEARSIRVERLNIRTVKLPVGIDRIRIAQISDVHLGLLVREDRLLSILEKVRDEDPDLLVCTGDLVDGSFGKVNHIPEIFDLVKPRYGKYAVTGNHEVYAGLAYSVESINLFGFNLLRGQGTQLSNVLNIAGVDDSASGAVADEAALLSDFQNGLFTLFLKHRPSVPPETQGLYDLQLSGHTHRGQIFPFNFVTKMFYPLQDGLYHLDRGSRLYTSRGSGTWGPPMRVLSPPEVTIIDLVRE